MPTSETVKPLLPSRTLSVGFVIERSTLAEPTTMLSSARGCLPIISPAPAMAVAPIVAPIKSRRLTLLMTLHSPTVSHETNTPAPLVLYIISLSASTDQLSQGTARLFVCLSGCDISTSFSDPETPSKPRLPSEIRMRAQDAHSRFATRVLSL